MKEIHSIGPHGQILVSYASQSREEHEQMRTMHLIDHNSHYPLEKWERIHIKWEDEYYGQGKWPDIPFWKKLWWKLTA